jgi:single-strand DNA-binding protein
VRSTITLSGNVTGNVTLRSTPSGPVASFRLAVDDGWFDRSTQQWQSRTVFLQVSAWRRLAENVAGSLALGQPVIVVGRLRQSTYEKEGQTRTSVELVADSVGHDLSRGSAVFMRNPRGPQTSDLAVSGVQAVAEHTGTAA